MNSARDAELKKKKKKGKNAIAADADVKQMDPKRLKFGLWATDSTRNALVQVDSKWGIWSLTIGTNNNN